MNYSSTPLVVEIWSDFACPWCWVAKRRFEQALEGAPYAGRVQVEVRAYRLAPDYAAEPMAQAVAKKLGSQAAARAMMDAVSQHAAAAGLDYRFETMLFGDTMDAHVLVKAVPTRPCRRAWSKRCTNRAFLMACRCLTEARSQRSRSVPAYRPMCLVAPGPRRNFASKCKPMSVPDRRSHPAFRFSSSIRASMFLARSRSGNSGMHSMACLLSTTLA